MATVVVQQGVPRVGVQQASIRWSTVKTIEKNDLFVLTNIGEGYPRFPSPVYV
jgi:hypothetical protein